MFYFTIYRVFPNDPEYVHIGTALRYSNKSDAEKFMNFFIDGAKALGAVVEEKDGYTHIEGNLAFSFKFGGFEPFPHKILYIVGIESDEEKNLYSLADEKEGDKLSLYGTPFEDGHAFEAELAQNKEQTDSKKRAEKERADRIVNNFRTQLEGASDIRSILQVLIKFSKQKIDKNLILDEVANKIEGRTKKDTSTDNWYDELSDINK